MKWEIRSEERKRGIEKLVVLFVCVMLFFTIFSRIIHNATTAKVTVTSPSVGKISHEVYGTGTVTATEETPVILPEGVLLDQYYCKEGQRVEIGDQLLKIDISSLQKKISEYSDEIKKLNLQNQELLSQQTIEKEKAIQNYKNACEDYERTVISQQKNVDSMKDAWERATQKLTEAQSKTEINEDELNTLKDAVLETKNAYENALTEQKNCVAEAQKNIDDNQVVVVESTQTQQNNIIIAQYQEKCDELDELVKAGGIVTAQSAGTIIKLRMEAGEFTTGNSVLTLAQDEQEIMMVAEFSKDDENYLSIGNIVEISNSENIQTNNDFKNLTIQSVSEKVDDTGILEVSVALPTGSIPIGSHIEFAVRTDIKNYDNCIDKAALHQDGDNSYYVYVVEESDTILGTQNIVRREKVELLDSDNQNVAVDGVFQGQKVVLESTRELNDKNPVNVQE